MWGTAAAVAVGVSGVLVVQGAAGGATGGASHADAGPSRITGPIQSTVHRVALRTGNDGSAAVAKRSTDPFSLLGVSWTDPSAKLSAEVEARTRDAASGRWSGWVGLEQSDPASASESPDRGATEPLWVGPSDGVEVRVAGPGGATSHKLPTGLQLDLVDPGTKPVSQKGQASAPQLAADSMALADTTDTPSPTDTSTATDSPSPTDSPTAADTPTDTPTATDSPTPTDSPTATPTTPSAAPVDRSEPPIVSRAGWGADESLSPEPPSTPRTVQGGLRPPHDGANDYACADSRRSSGASTCTT